MAPARNRSQTTSELLESPKTSGHVDKTEKLNPERQGDIFEKSKIEENADSPRDSLVASPATLNSLPAGFDELPIEVHEANPRGIDADFRKLASVTERFAASLTTAKIYSTPPSIEKLCDLFQDFYIQADAHIATHIQALSTRQGREDSPAPSISSRTSTGLKSLSRIGSNVSQDGAEQPDAPVRGQKMLTASEISERRRARKMLHHKRLALEEAVERKACEEVYDKIWRHKSALDEVRDEKLRSRTAALALVGIGLKDLGVDFDPKEQPSENTAASERAAEIEQWISRAREGILRMNESRHPLGKLQSLASAHRTIVDLLSALHQSSSSADEILPTLIYTLITCPPEGVNVISNLCFIQRFRATSRIDGEAAYCLTNLEAAITFLETVDLATLRSEEAVDLSSKPSSRTSTPGPEMSYPGAPKTTASPVTTPLTAVPTPPPQTGTKTSLAASSSPLPSSPSPGAHHRRLSSLFHPPASALGAAGDAVKSTADQGLRNVGAALDNSFNFLFGRLKEQRIPSSGSEFQEGVDVLPKTLDDARRLVSPKTLLDEDGALSEASSLAEPDDSSVQKEERLIEMIAGQSKDRDVSNNSARSASNAAKRTGMSMEAKGPSTSPSPSPSSAPATAVDSMRSLGSSFNPLNRLANMNMMRGFGKAATPQEMPPSSATPSLATNSSIKQEPSLVPLKIDPPVSRFLEMADARDLRLKDVDLLLKDYQRLARMLKEEGLA